MRMRVIEETRASAVAGWLSFQVEQCNSSSKQRGGVRMDMAHSREPSCAISLKCGWQVKGKVERSQCDGE